MNRSKVAFGLGSLAAGLGIVWLFAGCGKNNTDLGAAKQYIADNPIMKAVQLYGGFQTEHKRPPQNIDELKSWAKKLPKERLDAMKITDVDAACTSPRDNKPYAIAPPPRGAPGGIARVVIYEQQGVGGKRMTASMMGTQQEMDETQIRTHVPNLK